jgi:inner membrane protein
MASTVADVDLSVISRLSRPARLIGVALLALALLIPLGMVESVVRERNRIYQGVVHEIAASWSGDQRLAGPVLVVPYDEKAPSRDEYVTPEGEKKSTLRWETRRRRAILLPDELIIDGVIEPETRSRGIYDVQVYRADLIISGAFRGPLTPLIEGLVSGDRIEEIHWSEAVIGFGLSDPRGIVEVDNLHVDGNTIELRPGTTLGEMLPRGFHADTGHEVSDGLRFELPIGVRGSGVFSFLPLGATTRETLASPWPHPSFTGSVLPVSREITDEGFAAEWTIPLLNRSYPQAWTEGETVSLDEIDAGVRLFQPVALYDMVTRAVKYGLLFIVLTFLTLGLIEYASDSKLSLVQFLLVGVALAMFFLLLIALAEHLGFTTAYLLASATIVVINTLYCAAMLGSRKIGLVVGAVLAATYGVLYLILKAEDFALLGGTLLLVVALVVTMYLTRRVNLRPVADPEP